MTSRWQDFGFGPWPATGRVPGVAPDEATRRRLDLPRTLRPVPGEGVVQRPVFDPALKQHVKAMRAGEPQFRDERVGARWYAARRAAFDHVLAAIADSRWADHLVLRGSVLLAAWLGPAAREPGDLDFVVVPRSWHIHDGRTQRMFDDIAHRSQELSWPGHLGDSGVQVQANGAVSEEIWTYDRVPGRRLVLPWRAEGLPPGSVQLDFVFGEPLPRAPEPTTLPRSDGGEPPVLLTATPGLSLAWKVLWLLTDMHPQAKDVYDAMLLAESPEGTTPLDARLLRETLVAADTAYASRPPGIGDLSEAVRSVDWDEFRKEYPDLPIDPDGMHDRLLDRLAGAFTEPVDPPGPEYYRRAGWLAPRIEECRGLLAEQGMAAVRRALAGRVRAVDAAVIVSELLGRGPQDIDASVWELLNSPEWTPGGPGTGELGYYRRNPGWLEEELAALRG
ncbi:Nucleotidyl transferase AbiEii toxin, Type IV TA system [Thermomonospora echinospora]|uniref:Nucleotidyl transferase AbiEii toxin, Type IV TA system n=1 Tax=Thermomonospora echinospora TaxID=1992 RepID=A0A1H6AU24_9ACTN|nr:nucleotidyl transferase AbiEii/AbiGii toxin family protein [Thermomonospora echinospora]SEG52153.1 Nucleotidyl transferase AbiEii toxin, Type IV TA system [Thermomonospora echinospora]